MSDGGPGVIDLSVIDGYAAHCPLCRTPIKARIWRILDLDAHPDRRGDLEDGTLQRSFCPACIGPGVERLGAICVVGGGPHGRSRAFFAFDRTTVEDSFATLETRFAARCAAAGLDPAGVPMISQGLVETLGQIAEALDDASGFQNPTGARRLQAAVSLVFAKDGDARRAILLANPDITRPGAIRALASLPDLDPRLPRVRVRPILALMTATSRRGLDAALEALSAETEGEEALRRMPEPDREAYFRALPDDLGPAASDPAALEARVAQLLTDQPTLHGGLRATLYLSIGEAWQDVAARAGDAAAVRARGWLDRVATDPDPAVSTRSRLDAQVGLSASWDTMLSGDPVFNNRQVLRHAEAAAALAQDLSDEDMAIALTELGVARTRQVAGDPFTNRALAREAFERAKLPGASNLTRLMVAYNEALTWIEENSGDLAQKIGVGITMLQVLLRQARGLFDTGRLQQLHQSLGAGLLRRGVLLNESEDVAAAENHFAQAVRLARERGEDGARLLYLHLAARVEMMARGAAPLDGPGVLETLDAIQQDYGAFAAPGFYAQTERLRALVFEKIPPRGTPPGAALRARRRVIEALTAAGALAPAVDALRLAEGWEAAGDLGAASQAYAQAATAAEERLAASSTSARLGEEIGETSPIYNGLVRTLAAQDGVDGWRVLAAMERGRARDLLEGLGGRDLPPPVGAPPALIAEETQLRSVLAAEPQDEVAAMVAEPSDVGRRLRGRQALRERLDALYAEIAACGEAGAAYVRLRRPQPPDVDALRALITGLGTDTGVLSYWIEETGAVGVFVKAGAEIVVRRLPFGAAQAQATLEALQADVGAPFARETDGSAPPDGASDEAWRRAGRRWLAPFEAEIAGCAQMVIVPHGVGHRLPFPGLVLSEGAALVEVVATQVVPSLGILADLAPPAVAFSPERVRVLCCASTREERTSFEAEARTVAALLGAAPIFDARRADLIERVADLDIVHLVGHGRFDPEEPLAGELVLSDGVVKVRDLLAVRLNASLISLAACETGILSSASGDRLRGFSQALMLAGARMTLLTLWNVWSEPTRWWMEHFYAAVSDPKTAAAGLAQAHRAASLATRARFPHPAFWAGFVLSGRPRDARPRPDGTRSATGGSG